MTREEFFEDIGTMSDLIQFCDDEGLEGFTDDLYNEDDFNDAFERGLADYIDDWGWRDAFEEMSNMPDSGFDYYRKTNEGVFDWVGIGNYEFDCIKSSVDAYMTSNELWDEEEEEEIVEDDNSATEEDEGLAIEELFSLCNNSLREIGETKEEFDLDEPTIEKAPDFWF